MRMMIMKIKMKLKLKMIMNNSYIWELNYKGNYY